MLVDPSIRKRLALEVENNEKGKDDLAVPVGTLALTQGNGEGIDANKLPSSSSSSKRARIGCDGVSGDISAAFLEEDRRAQ